MSRSRFGFLVSLLFRDQKMCRTSTSMAQKTTQMNKNKFLIVGLGNYDYPGTRHNIGMIFVDWLADHLNIKWTSERKLCKGYVTSCKLQDDVELILLKPKVPMNINGQSVSMTVSEFGIPVENIFIIQDELDKSLGKYAIKSSGSSRGHNGVKSVMDSLQTDEFTRIKFGIGRPDSRDSNIIARYVLSEFTPAEQQKVFQLLPTAVEYLEKQLQKASGFELELGKRIT
ncbi:hypothetical protein LOTGIDRAFT_232922 [Lottia gigantea]|uniref:Peptidyl-tRNA hydrolase n=1 Tax=Lottia gigantea TaxID=225164 RepID=V4AHE6_LOTGI|nr:hypothetical protein LOTGIDRAFT_232922 [Lottia gigantea]ESO92816.1 hypothetical protein LOTGIDRAFT_232922 [Lottia gigantea]